jgi:hypothetical protein
MEVLWERHFDLGLRLLGTFVKYQAFLLQVCVLVIILAGLLSHILSKPTLHRGVCMGDFGVGLFGPSQLPWYW